MSDSIVIDTPDGMAHFAMCQIISRLSIEVKTGMKFRQSTLAVAKQHYGITAGTKKKGLEQMKALYKQTYGKEYGETNR